MNKRNLILASVLAIIFTSILIIFSPSSKKTSSSSLTPTPTSTESISPTPNPTADWKTCINSTKNFSINFPQELNFDEKSCNYSLVDYNNVENIEVVDSTTDFQKNWLFSIDVIDSDLSPSDFINNKVCEVPDICSDPIQGILPSSLEINISSHYPETDTIFKSNGKIFTFSLNARNPDTKPATGVRDLYHQVLSTFKFIDPTADWKTYENKEYGFSFKYPQNTTLTNAENDTYLISDELTNFTSGDNTSKIYLFLNSRSQGWAGGGDEPDYKIEKIDNIDAKRYSTTRQMNPSEKLDIVKFSKDGIYYNIELSWYGNDKSTTTTKIFNQILSSFKFTP